MSDTVSSRSREEVAMLGLGLMGSAMAARLLTAGFGVRVWNRTAKKCRGAGETGAVCAETPASAARGAGIVITMLADGAATEGAMVGYDGALTAMAPGSLWLQMGTVGAEACDRLAELAAAVSVAFVDAPVLGSRVPAERGELVVLASGPAEVQERTAAVFAALGKKTLWLGPAGTGSRLKLVVNAWILSLVASVAETVALSRSLSIDPALFLDAIAGREVDSPYAQIKGNAMINEAFEPAFPLRLACKDARLIVEAGESGGVDLPVLREVAAHFADALAQGHGEDDMAAVVTAVRTQAPAS